jgi:gluconokinase
MSPTTLVVMGCVGAGKSTVGEAVANRLGWAFVEGDELHPAANRLKMAGGVPLTDEDREPWLRRIAGRIAAQESLGLDSVVTCSGLRRAYRALLADRNGSVRFVALDVPETELARRLAARRDHFMPPTLLRSQLAAFEPLAADEPGVTVDATGEPAEVATRVLEAFAGLA